MRTLRVIAVPTGIRPIAGMLDKPVFHRIEPTSPDVIVPILFVADVVFQKPPLPHPMLAPPPVTFPPRDRRHRARKPGLDHAPPHRKIRVPLGQRPDAMPMVRQHHPRVDPARPFDPPAQPAVGCVLARTAIARPSRLVISGSKIGACQHAPYRAGAFGTVPRWWVENPPYWSQRPRVVWDILPNP